MVERDGGDKMMEHMGFHNAVHDVSTNETEFSINGRSGATSKIPNVVFIVRKLRVSVLQVSDGDYNVG